MMLKMFLAFVFLIMSAALLICSKDANINKKCDKNVFLSTIQDEHLNFDDSLADNGNSVQNGSLNLKQFATEALLLDLCKEDSCMSENKINNINVVETTEYSTPVMKTSATNFAQITKEKSSTDENNSGEFKGSEINSVICTDSSCSTVTNNFVNVNKMADIQSRIEDNSENVFELKMKSNSDIKMYIKKDTSKNYFSENSNHFVTEPNTEDVEINNKLTEEGRNKNKDGVNLESFSESSNEFRIISDVDIMKTVDVTSKKDNTENISKNKNAFTVKRKDISEANTSMISIQNSEIQSGVEVNSERYLSVKNMSRYISETVDNIQNRTVDSIHERDDFKDNISTISKTDNIEENSTSNISKKLSIGSPLNSTIDKNVLTDNPKFEMLKDDQQHPRRTEKQIAESKLEFPEVPEGDSFHIQELGLSEGIFVFSYLSRFLSWIQPYDFPVELLRDALWNRVSVVDLITQSLQVEVGFIICLSIGVLLALGLPCILMAHACCRLLNTSNRDSSWSDETSSETANNCAVNFRRCTLVFVVQLILLLLVAGIVSMFVTNEQMSRAVEQTPSVVHTALRDVTTFLRNSHQQLQFVITKSLDQAVDAAYTDLDNVEELLGRPIQEELAEETGIDVALDALVDVSTAARIMSGKVEDLLTTCLQAREMVMESREQLADLRMQVDMFRQQCPARFRPLCNTVNASGLDVVLRLDTVMSDDRLVQIRDLRDGNLSVVTQQARGEFQYIPLRVEKDTRDARNGVKRQLNRQKEVLDNSIWSLDVVTRDLTYKIENSRSQVLQVVQGVSAIEQWRWLTGLGAALSVLLLWILLLSGITCGCCGVAERAAPTLLASVVLMCLFSIVLWALALTALLVGGHGEVFICRPLYDEPDFSALTRLVDRPGVLFQRGGGFFSNLLYGNSTMDVPLRDVLQKCQGNESTYSAFKLKQVFDVDSSSNHRQWNMLHAELSRLQVNLSNMVLLTPELQQQLQELLLATTVNITSFRTQMTGQVTGKDLASFADQMSSVANQITDWSTLNRLESLISMTRNILTGHIQPLEQHKEDLVYQLTGLEMQLAPLQRQVNQSLSHLKTIQYYINNQGDSIAYQKSQVYMSRLIGYMDQYRAHVLNKTQHHIAPCRPVWNLYHAMRLLLCRHIMDPLNGFWFATVWCLVLFLAATPPCLKLIDHYKHLKNTSSLLRSRSSESPSETLMIPEQSAPWSTPGAPENDGW